MSTSRKIAERVTGSIQYDGAGVRLVRVLGHDTVRGFDPFLMLDAFDSRDPNDYIKGFPWHPHRGIETITYLVEGHIEHRDSLSNQGDIFAGCCQWMTAGSGIMHQEMPKPAERMLGIQLWLNMPAEQKMCAPRYNDIRAEDIPVIAEGDAEIRVLSGEYGGVKGPMVPKHTPMIFFDVRLRPGAKWSCSAPDGFSVFLYAFTGGGEVEGDADGSFSSREAFRLEGEGEVPIRAGADGVHLLFLAGLPLHEPIAWGGPIVMNTHAELSQAFRELQDGTFIRE